MKYVEIVCAVLFVAAIYLSFTGIPGGNVLVVVSACALANLYFVASFALMNGIGFRGIIKKESFEGIAAPRFIIAVTVGITLSILLVGLMFKIMFWPGANVQLMAGIVCVALIGAVALFMAMSQSEKHYWGMVVRCGFWLLPALFFWITSSETLLHWKHPKDPGYVKARIAADADPTNDSLQTILDEERLKIEQRILTEELEDLEE